jgi:hypothetical protein
MATDAELRVVRAADVAARAADTPRCLIESLWGAGAVGVIGGAPKSCKSWLALEMAVAVASGRPCLGRFAVCGPGTVLVYMAEDAPVEVRARLENLALARGTDFAALESPTRRGASTPSRKGGAPDPLLRSRGYGGSAPVARRSQSMIARTGASKSAGSDT